jgi:hypothetical protein
VVVESVKATVPDSWDIIGEIAVKEPLIYKGDSSFMERG